MTARPLRTFRAPTALAVCAALAGCMVGPNYQRPSAPISPTFKEAAKEPAGWTTAAPADAIERGEWWTLFNDPTLNGLEARVRISNQNVAAAEAAYRQARALVAEQRSALFPTIDLGGQATRTGGGARSGGSFVGSAAGGTVVSTGAGRSTVYRLSLDGSWTLDVWGRIRRQIEAARAEAEASAADLAAATLSAQGELAADYFGLREADAEVALDQETVEGYRRTVQITGNQYRAGIAPHSDLLQAQTQLDNALAALEEATRTRATYEHAIAVLVGEAPGNFTIAPLPNWNMTVPEVPAGLPSTLLQRRPDIAAAERRMASANAQIGVATAAFFPDLTLTGSYGFTGTELAGLLGASNALWSVGGAAAQSVFAGGLHVAQLRAARAGYDQTVATYRQTVLTGLQQVEDNLAATRVLARQYALRRDAAAASTAAAQMTLNQYRAGQVSFTNVVVANASAFAARIALAQSAGQRQSATVALIQALGGGWRADQAR